MLVIPTYLADSPIQGTGVFAAENVQKGSTVWIFDHRVDRIIRPDDVGDLPAHVIDFLDKHAWLDNNGYWRIGIDNDKFTNHSDNPNVGPYRDMNSMTVALRDIAKGEEITEDYSQFSDVKRQCGIDFE